MLPVSPGMVVGDVEVGRLSRRTNRIFQGRKVRLPILGLHIGFMGSQVNGDKLYPRNRFKLFLNPGSAGSAMHAFNGKDSIGQSRFPSYKL